MPNIRKLSPVLAKQAAIEVNENPERIEKDLTYLKDWIAQNPHLIARIDDQWLIVFLRACHYSLEQAKTKLDMFYTIKSIVPEIFRDRDVSKNPLKLLIENHSIIPIVDDIDETRPFIIYFRQTIDPSIMTPELPIALLKHAFMTAEIFFYENDSFAINGVIAIVDLDCLHMNHLKYIPPSVVKKCFKAIENAYPARVKGIHFINVPLIFETLLKVIKMVCSAKLASRIHVHKGVDTLFDHIPKRLMPSDLGGDRPSRKEADVALNKKLAEYHDWMVEEEHLGTNEKLRTGKSISSETFLGIEGSFRQLSVD